MEDLIRLYTRALSEWGGQAQIGMVHEEIGELLIELGQLIVSINQYNRGRKELDDILEEIVDVEIMMEQLTLILAMTDSSGNIDSWLQKKDELRDKKLKRLVDRVAKSIERRTQQNAVESQ